MIDPIEVIKELIRHPSVSTDSRYAEGMEATRAVLMDVFVKMGLETAQVATARHPLILAKRTGPESWPHVIIYGHYDVQPPDPLNEWISPPFEPVQRGNRLYGRGSADNKGPMMVHIAAVAQLLEEVPELPLRITFLIEGEEEIGSPSLPAILDKRRFELTGDYILISDTLNPSDDQVSITTGLRGMMCFEIEVSGPKQDLHSGLHGGAVRNPVQALCALCASLHDSDGRVAIDGFYDAVLPAADWELDHIARIPQTAAEYAASVGVPEPYMVPNRTPMEAIRLEPTLEFNGIYGGYQGEGDKTIIPARACAKISCRLVANQDPEQIKSLVYAALRARTPKGVRLKIRDGHGGMPYCVVPPGQSNTPVDQNPVLANAFHAADRAVTEVFGLPPLYLREGGSIPIIGTMKQLLGMDCILLGMGTAENNLHGPNESFNLDTLQKGIAVSKQILLATAQRPR